MYMMQSGTGKICLSQCVVVILFLIGWKGGVSILSELYYVADAKPITFQHSNENHSIF